MFKDQIPADDVLRIVTAADGAVVVAIYDRAEHCLDVTCSRHMVGDKGSFTFRLSRGIAATSLTWYRDETARAAAKHAAIRHPKPRVDSGGPR